MRIGLHPLTTGLGERGGIQVFVRELVRALADHGGSDEYVVLLGPGDEPPPGVGSGRVTFVRLTPEQPALGRLRRKLRTVRGALSAAFGPPARLWMRPTAIDQLALDLVHFAAPVVLPVRRTPYVVTIQDVQERFLPQFFTATERLRRRLALRAAVRLARLVHVPSEHTRRCLIDLAVAPPERICVVPHGVPERFRRLPVRSDEDSTWSVRLRLPAGPFIFFPANPWPHKNHERLFRAVRLAAGHLGCTLPVVCTGRLRGAARSAAAVAREVAPEVPVHDLGFVDEEAMPSLYRLARLTMFPSLYEGFGLPVAEAMACGCPVACARATALVELGAEAARFFDPLDETDMAQAIADLWVEGPVRSSVIASGLARAADLRWPVVLPQLHAVYRRAREVLT